MIFMVGSLLRGDGATAPIIDGFFAYITQLKKSVFVELDEFGGFRGIGRTEMSERM